MPLFKYEALDSQGVAIKNEVEALSQKEAVSKIRNMGYFPTKVMAVGGGKKKAQLRPGLSPSRRKGEAPAARSKSNSLPSLPGSCQRFRTRVCPF